MLRQQKAEAPSIFLLLPFRSLPLSPRRLGIGASTDCLFFSSVFCLHSPSVHSLIVSFLVTLLAPALRLLSFLPSLFFFSPGSALFIDSKLPRLYTPGESLSASLPFRRNKFPAFSSGESSALSPPFHLFFSVSPCLSRPRPSDNWQWTRRLSSSMSLSLPLFFSFCCTRQRRKQRGRASCQVWGLVCSRRLYACPHLCKRGEKKRGKFFIMKGPSPSSSSSPSFLRLDWRVACLLRQLHAQLVGEDSSSSSSLSSSSSSTPLFSLLVGIQLSDSSLLALSSFRLPCTERILRTKPLVPSSFFSSSSLPPSVLEEALRRDLRTLASALPRGLQVLGLLYHNSSSSSSPLLDGRPSGGASLGEGEDVSGSALQLSSSVLSSGLSLLKRCLDRLLQEEGADFCLTLSLPSADRRTDEGRKKSRVIPKEEKEDLVCIGGLPSSLDCEGDQPGEAVPDKDTAFTSPTHAVPWRFSTFVFSSSGNAFSSLSSSSLLKVSVEDALAVLRTEKLVFLRSQLLLEFPFEGEHHEIRRRIEGGARSVSGCARFMEEKNGGSRGSKLKDGEDVPEEEDGKATAEGEDSEDYLVEISSDLGEDILDGLRKQEEAMTGSSRSLFFCMPNGVYVHPSDEGEEEDDESRAEEDKAKKGSSGGKKDKNSLSKGDGDNTLWSAVSTAAKSCGTSVSLSVSSSSCAGQTNPLALPWLTPMENEPKKTCPVPFSFSSLSAVPIPAFLNSVSLLLQSHHAGSPAPDSASSSRSVFSKNNSDSGCMYTTPPRPATCIATCVSSAGAESDSQVTSSLASALAVGIQTQLDVCLFVPGSSSLTSVANELRIAFVSQIRQLAVQVFSSITDEQRPGSGSSFRKKTPALRSTLLSGVSASQATGEAFDLSSSSATSSSDDLSYPSSLPFFPRFLPLFSSSPALKENDRSSSEDGKRTSRTALPSSKETSAAKTRNARSNSYFYQGTGLIGLNFSVVKTLYTCHPLVLGGYVHSRTLRRRWLEILANGRVSPAFRRSASLPWNEAEKFEMKLLNVSLDGVFLKSFACQQLHVSMYMCLRTCTSIYLCRCQGMRVHMQVSGDRHFETGPCVSL